MFGFTKKRPPAIDECAFEPAPTQVKCDECKHYVDRADAQFVELVGKYGYSKLMYCPMHRRPYDRVDSTGETTIMLRLVEKHYEKVPPAEMEKK